MARAPYPGACKTRLCPPFTEREAASLYAAFIEDIARLLLREERDYDVVVAWSGEDRRADDDTVPEALLGCFGESTRFSFLRQRGESLTERMAAVFEDLFAAGWARIVMRNTDSPHLPASFVDEAMQALRVRPGRVVLGPDLDGGYYLIGADKAVGGPGLRATLPDTMSTGSVLSETEGRALAAGWDVIRLAGFPDVDTPDDVAMLWLELSARADVRDWATYRLLEDGLKDRLGERA
jgi:glycosyltransferase A (GT-A) superfamily protein (DUF2064 family)